MSQGIPFSSPDIGEEEINEVLDSLRSGWLTTGPKTKRFEADFSAFIGNGIQAVAVNSATAGLHLALEALGIGPGDEVITTPYTFTSTAAVIRHLGADPVLADIAPETLNINPVAIEAAITSRTKAILPVHFAGLACDMKSILTIARRHGLTVVEDAAHAIPSTCSGTLIGAGESDAVVFSFYATKTMTTGEGGMIVTRNPEVAQRCRNMRQHGISRDAFERCQSAKAGWSYEVLAPGFKYNMTDIAASLGLHRLKKIWQFQKKRALMAERYDAAFKDLPLILPSHAPEGDTHAWYIYVIRLGNDVAMTRDSFIERMAKMGIGCSVHFIPLHLHPFWRDRYHLKPESFPDALHAFERAVSLPLYTKMTDEEQERVIAAVRCLLG